MITRRKEHYPVSTYLGQYLVHFGRYTDIPLVYDDLAHFNEAVPYENPAGEETLWQTVLYPREVMTELAKKLTRIYAVLKIGGDMALAENLFVERIDFGSFGNSRPFRIRITNQFNGNSDYYYVKVADSSRVYGLELEHILSPNRIHYLLKGNTLIEEHIAGVPGDMFIRTRIGNPLLNRVRVAKEFVKFNERCFIRLLGDMRSVNYVVDITPDFEETQYRVRSIDFDQQSYEGKLAVYRAHLFEDNQPVDELVHTHLNEPTIQQYRSEERSQMARRVKAELQRLRALLVVMGRDRLAPDEHVTRLAAELGAYHHSTEFEGCRSMGDLTAVHIRRMLGL